MKHELKILALVYIGAFFIGSMTIAACGPGCCFIFYSILTVVSALLMLRQEKKTRIICFCLLCLFVVGMWHEKEVRDTWSGKMQAKIIEKLQKDLAEKKP